MKVSIGCFAKLENLYLREWCEYHLALGFCNIHIYDNNDKNSEHCSSAVEGLDDVYVYDDFRGVSSVRCNQQIQAYDKLYNKLSKESPDIDYIIFLDIDEFFTLDKKYSSVSDYFDKVFSDKPPVIRFCQVPYGASGHVSYSSEKVVERFTVPALESAPEYNYAKHGYKLRSGLKVINPHFCERAQFDTRSDGRKVSFNKTAGVPPEENCIKEAYLRHYITKSAEEYCVLKCCKTKTKEYRYNMAFFFQYNKKTPDLEQAVRNWIEHPEKSGIITDVNKLKNKAC